MRADEASRRSQIAAEQGHDRKIVDALKKIRYATECSETEVCIAVYPWYKWEEKHVQFFTSNGYEVEMGKEAVYIRWKGTF